MITFGLRAKSSRLCSSALLLLVCLSWTPSSRGLLTGDQREQIANFIRKVVKCRQVPGLSVGVVFGDGHDPKDVFTSGFGLEDVEKNVSASSTTRFAIGAISSTFTTTLISKLLHANKGRFPKGWDTKVKEIFGNDFRLSDNLRTDYTTLRDLAAHKTGYPQYESLVVGLDHSVKRADYCRRYFLLQPKYEFRSGYHYSREMFTLLGCVAEVLGEGQSWEELVTSYILQPLQMTSSSFVRTTEDVAKSYIHDNNTFVRLDDQLLRAIYPCEVAEGMVSTADDMATWLHYHLLNVANMSQIQEGEVLEQTYLPQVQYSLGDMRPKYKHKSPLYEKVFAHNLGWESGYYDDFAFVQQTGQLPGFTSKLMVFRDISLGIFVSMNIGSSVKDELTADFITWDIVDLLLPIQRPTFLHAESSCSHEIAFDHKRVTESGSERPLTMSFTPPPFAPPGGPRLSHSGSPPEPNPPPPSTVSTERPQTVEITGLPTAPSPGSPPTVSVDTAKSKPLEWEKAFVGTYGHQMFGNITISYNSTVESLSYKAGLVGDGLLQENGKAEKFTVNFSGPLSYMHKISPEKEMLLHFRDLKDGQFVSLGLPDDEIVYGRGVTWDLPHSSGSSNCLCLTIIWTSVLLTMQFVAIS